MKTALVLVLALAAYAPAQAQIFRSPVFGGAVVGAIIGHNSGSLGHNAWRGAAYGAAAGLLIDGAFGPGYYGGGYGYYGSIDRRSGRSAPRVYVYQDAPVVYGDYGYDYNYDYAFARPNYQASGLWLGALAGAIIGRNSGSLGHNAWRGAAYGAGAGYLLGSIAENNVRRREVLAGYPVSVPAANTASAQPQQVTIINNYYNTTPMSSANGLFGR